MQESGGGGGGGIQIVEQGILTEVDALVRLTSSVRLLVS
jgi:hypothetical protein